MRELGRQGGRGRWSGGTGGAGGSGHTHVPQSATLTRDENGAVETVTSIGIDLVEGDTWTISRNPNESVASLTNATDATPPSGWLIKWDASTSDGIDYLTDEATNDVDSWESQEGPEALGTLLLEDTGVASLYPEWVRDADGYAAVHIQNDGGLWHGNISAGNADLAARIDGAVDVTVFMCAKLNDPTTKGSNNYFCHGSNGVRYSNVGADDSVDFYANAAFRTATGGYDDRRFIASHRNVHVGTNDNDLDCWMGKDSVYSVAALTDAAVAGPNSITFGSYSDASNALWDTDVNVYEVLIYGKALTDAEHSDVVDYLSAKWQATNADNAVDTISEASDGPFYLVTVDRDGGGIITGVTATTV